MSSTVISDPTAALCAYLADQVGDLLGLNGQGGPAVYRPEIPKSDDALMPQAAVSVRVAGGIDQFAPSRLPASTGTFDVSCFGSNRLQADQVARAVRVALKQLVMTVCSGVMLYSASPENPLPLPDQQTLWPTTVVTGTVMYADYGVSD